MSSEFAELLSTWYTEEELEEKYREFALFVLNIVTSKERIEGSWIEWYRDCYEEAYKEAKKKGCEEVRREIAAKLIQSGMSLEQISQITKLPLETLDSL